MNDKTLKITQGALITAIFGVIMFLNRQTAGILEGLMMYIIPLPMAVYAAKYGMLSSLPVFASMTLIGFFLGTPDSAIYAMSELITGMIFGVCLNRKRDPNHTMMAVMICSVLINLLNLIILAALFGMDINVEMQEINDMITKMFEMRGTEIPAGMLDTGLLKRILIISTAIAGVIQGFIIYTLGLVLMRKLRMNVQKPRSVYEYHPPVWTGWLALALFFMSGLMSGFAAGNESMQTVIMTVSLTAYMYLILFGFLAMNLLLRRFMPRLRFICSLLSFMFIFILPWLEMILGFMYITGIGSSAGSGDRNRIG